MVPKLAMVPADCDAPREIAIAVRVSSSLRREAQAAAAPIEPKIPVGCQPLA